jgi:phosphoserine phosphatase/GNAT superfamily N-acetyltransferase
VAVIAYTSGTTGRPKGALLTHDNLAATVCTLHDAWRWSASDVLFHALPLFHIHGLFVAQYGALWAGASTLWTDRFDAAEALRTLERRGCTVFMGVPTFYQRFLDLGPEHRADLSRMRLFTCGSAALPAATHRAFHERFGHRILERYGMTEAGIVLSNPYEGERRPGAVGHPLPGVQARIVDPSTREVVVGGEVGELQIRGPSVFAGYLGQPERTAEAMIDGFLCTGDLGRLDAEGYVHLVGRSRDVVITGGLNVYPSEVESALVEHPDILEAAVVGVRDPDLGERPVASLVMRDGASIDGTSLDAFLSDKLATYKRPRDVRLLPTLPRNAMGKVQKAVLERDWSLPVVRPARPGEAAAIARRNVTMALETEGVVLDPATALEGTEAVFARPATGARYFVADVAGRPVGQCMVTREWSDWRARDVWWLQSVFVEPGWRGAGVYRSLHAAVVEAAKQEGAGGLRLYVDRRNASAAEVYRRVGMSAEHYAMYEQMFHEPPAAGATRRPTSSSDASALCRLPPRRWDPTVRSSLERMAHEHGRRGSAYDPRRPPVAVFDWDNTSIRGDIGEAFLATLDEDGGCRMAEYGRLCATEGKAVGYAWAASQIAGFEESALREAVSRIVDTHLADGRIALRPELRDLCALLQQLGWDVWVVSASAEPLVQVFAQAYGIPFDHVIGMRLDRDARGTFLAGVVGPVTYRQGKVDAIDLRIGVRPHFAVGDTDTDIEMLQTARHRLVIDAGSPTLRTLAEAQGWWIHPRFDGPDT